jgi:hypothetical protein
MAMCDHSVDNSGSLRELHAALALEFPFPPTAAPPTPIPTAAALPCPPPQPRLVVATPEALLHSLRSGRLSVDRLQAVALDEVETILCPSQPVAQPFLRPSDEVSAATVLPQCAPHIIRYDACTHHGHATNSRWIDSLTRHCLCVPYVVLRLRGRHHQMTWCQSCSAGCDSRAGQTPPRVPLCHLGSCSRRHT